MALKLPDVPSRVDILPPQASCPACGDFGYLPQVGWTPPERASMRELLENAMPCACPLGDDFRAVAEEWKQPIVAKDSRTIHAGTVPLWEAA